MVESPIVEKILKDRIFVEGETSYSDVCKRVSNFLFKDTADRTKFYNLMSERKIVPASPYLMQAGTKHPQLSSCFTIPVEDSLDSIFGYVNESAKVFQRSGGVGTNWSALRPEGASISSGGQSTGPMSFMGVFDQMVEAVRHGGKKKGAAIAILDIDHPDIEKFITMKNTEGAYKNFNISVMITDDFMKRFIAGGEKEVNLMNLISQSIWTRAEPGIVWYDTVNKTNPVRRWKLIKETNPCGEEPLVPYGSCNLIGVNWGAFVRDGKIDYNALEDVIRIVVRAADNAIDLNEFPLPELKKVALYIRQIGIYPLGMHDMLIKMGLPYDSEVGRDAVRDVAEFVERIAWDESVKIGKVKGPAPVVKDNLTDGIPSGARNSAVTTAAPGGTTSLIANCSNGIEPVFSYVMTREGGHGSGNVIINDLFIDAVKQLKIPDDAKDSIFKEMHTYGSIQHISSLPKSFRDIFKTALDITPKDHILMQATVQRYTTAGISKTVNCPEIITPEGILSSIKFAWEQGCKGITFYRQNSRNEVVYGLKKDKPAIQVDTVDIVNPVKYRLIKANGRILAKTPRETPSTMYKRNTGCGKMMIAIGEVDGKPHSVTIVNKGGCDAMTQALAEMTSLCERYGIPQWNINKLLSKIKCSAAMQNPKSDGKSCPNIIGTILNEYYPHDEEPPKNDEEAPEPKPDKSQSTIVCPECGKGLIYQSGCVSCTFCGYSRCN